MAKLKDGFYKQVGITLGSNDYLLLAGGGHKAISDFAPVSWWNWVGHSEQPSWVWGGNTENKYYVYNPSNFSVKSAGRANLLYSNDNRSIDIIPREVLRGLHADFKSNSTDSLLDGGDFHGVLTFRPYGSSTDNTGGGIHQLAMTENSNIYYRHSKSKNTSHDSWNSWKKIAWESEIPTITDYYWANIKISSSSNVNTNPTFGTTYIKGIPNYREGIRLLKTESALTSVWFNTEGESGYTKGMWGLTANENGHFRLRGGTTACKDLITIDPNGNTGINKIPHYSLDSAGIIKTDKYFIAEVSTYNQDGGLKFYKDASLKAELGASAAGEFGIYCTNKIYIRPSLTNYNLGLEITSTDITYNNNSIWHTDNLKIGGRNLVANSKTLLGCEHRTTETYNGFNIAHTTHSGNYIDTLVMYSTINVDSVDYIVSFYAKASLNNTITCFFYAPNTTTYGISSTGQTSTSSDGAVKVSITSEWKKYWVRWTLTIPSPLSTKRIILGRITSGDCFVCSIKLEEGTIPTMWTPAPEDLSYVGHTHNYLPLSGGTLSSSSRNFLNLNSTSGGPYINFNVNNVTKALIGALLAGDGAFLLSGGNYLAVLNDGTIKRKNTYLIWDSGNDGAGSGLDADTVDGYQASTLWRSDGGRWNPNANISLIASGNNQEWSFDIDRKGKTGCYWHVWDTEKSTMLKVSPDNGKVYAPYNFVGNLEGNASTTTKLQTARKINGISFDGSKDITITANPTEHKHSILYTERILDHDARSEKTFPNDYSDSLRFRGYKESSSTGLSTTCALLGLKGYTADGSGGPSYEFAFGDNYHIYYRTGSTIKNDTENKSTWRLWYKLWSSYNFNPADYLPIAGGTLTGPLIVNSSILASKEILITSDSAGVRMYGGGGLFKIKGRGMVLYGEGDSTDIEIRASSGDTYYKIYHTGNSSNLAKNILGETLDLDNNFKKGLFGGKLFKATGTFPKDYDGEAFGPFLLCGLDKYCFQLLNRNSGKFYFRTINGYNWGDWYEIYHSGNLNPDNYLPLKGGNITGDLYIQQDVNTTLHYLRFLESSKLLGGYILYDGISNILNIGVHNLYDINKANDKNAISILRSNAYVGIGVAAPTQRLDVDGYVKASGFYKSGSSKDYVLLGDGGHKALSTFSLSGHTHPYLPLSGGTLTGLLTVPSISMSTDYVLTPIGNTVGWYRFAKMKSNVKGRNIIFSLSRNYWSNNNECYLYSISIMYNGNITITLLSGQSGGHLITKVRVVWKNSDIGYLDFYKESDDYEKESNSYYIWGIGDAEFFKPYLYTDTIENSVEYNTVTGFKTSNNASIGAVLNVLGDITTNASLTISRNGVNTVISPTNSSWMHYKTTAPAGHWFNNKLSVAGDIYGGKSYDRRVAYIDEISGNYLPIAGGTITNLITFTPQGNARAVLQGVVAGKDYIHLYVTNSTRPLVFQNGYGNVGIGLATPSEKLEVNGNVKASYFIGALKGIDNQPSNALLQTGTGRKDDATGSTWIFLDSLGGTSSPYGIKHNQVDNTIEYYGAGVLKSSISLGTGHIYTNGSFKLENCLRIKPNASNWCEGIRIYPHSDWTTIVLGGSDLTSDVGTSGKSWSLHSNKGNFYLNRGGSNQHTGYELCNINSNWGLGTLTPSSKLSVNGSISASDFIVILAPKYELGVKEGWGVAHPILLSIDANIDTSNENYKYHPGITTYCTYGKADSGSMALVPYYNNIAPWGRLIGLYLDKTLLLFNGNKIWHAGNFTPSNYLPTNYYWADIKISDKASIATSPSFNLVKAKKYIITHPGDGVSDRGSIEYVSGTHGWGNYWEAPVKESGGSRICFHTVSGMYLDGGNVNIQSKTNTNLLEITSLNGEDHLIFTRPSYNYIRASKSGGEIVFITNGKALGIANSDFIISPTKLYSHSNATNMTIGDNSHIWKAIYATDLYGNATSSTKVKSTKCTSSSNSKLWNTIRCSSDPLTFRVFDVYSDDGPSTYGDLLEITGISNHWQPLLWFDGGKGGRVRTRNKNYNDNTWGDWNILAWKSEIPTKVSQLTNDSGFLTSHLSLANYRKLGGGWTGYNVPGTREFGYVSNDGQGEVAFKYDNGTLNMIIDGNIYCTDNSYKVWHAGNLTKISLLENDSKFLKSVSWSTVTNKPFLTWQGKNSLDIIKNNINNVTTNDFTGIYLAHGAASYAFGWKLSGHADAPYCGYLVNNYGTNWDVIGASHGDWESYKLLHSGNSSVSKSGETLTVKINGISQSITNTSTHYTTNIVASTSGVPWNQETADPHITVTDDGKWSGAIQLIGGDNTTINSDANGKITIASSDTHYTTNIVAATSGVPRNLETVDPYINVSDNGKWSGSIHLVGGGHTTINSNLSGKVTISSTWPTLIGGDNTTINSDANGKITISSTWPTSLPASELVNTRYLWGLPFNGSANVIGDMSNVGEINGVAKFSSGGSNVRLIIYDHAEANNNNIHIFVKGGDNKRTLVLLNGYGNVGIGTRTPSTKLEVAGHITANGFIGKEATINGIVTALDVVATSDRRLKSNIKTLKDRGELHPVTFVKNGKKGIGFIALEIRDNYPELVEGEESENTYLAVNYAQLTAVLAAQLNDLRKEVEYLKSKLK